MSGPIGRFWNWFRSAGARRLLALVTVTIGVAVLAGQWSRLPSEDLQVGDVAQRTVRASASFPFVDWESTLERQREAEAQVQPVFDFDATLASRVEARVSGAFETARQRLTEATAAASASGREALSDEESAAISTDFLKLLGLSLDAEDVKLLSASGWDPEIEKGTLGLMSAQLRRFIVADRSLLPTPARTLSVVRVFRDSRDRVEIDDYERIRSPDEARLAIKMAVLDPSAPPLDAHRLGIAVRVAQAAVRPNFSYNQLITEAARREAREAVPEVVIQVKRGTALVRQGDVVTQSKVEVLAALRKSQEKHGVGGALLALAVFTALVLISLYTFASGYIKKFSTQPRDLEAAAFLALLVVAIGRLCVEMSDPLAEVVGLGMNDSSLWFLAPVAGGAMLTRILVNSETALMWTLVTSVLLGLVMEQELLYTVFFLISGVTAAGGISHTKERVNVLRAGLLTGLVNGAAALLINLLQIHMGEAAYVSQASPIWDMVFAFIGGNLSAVLVLGLVPMFEVFGFVTDYKLLELANLNHPLLRQLMLRAPGSYHHSVIVGSLAEAAAESIGCNALQTRVSCYFHDIGKAVKPNYFIENLRDAPNPHDRLAPQQSARIIINHVLDGVALAKQYKLPKPIIDGIEMHHGTGIIQYFYAKALEQAGADMEVDASDFRYPGVLPSTREAGIIFLADRAEAACRTLQDPTQESIRAMIQKLVNSAVMDEQLEHCPLTIRELYQVVDTFTNTLLGIYHHRIEYPGLPVIPPKGDLVPEQAIITLDVAKPESAEQVEDMDQASGRPPAEA
jgi:putative nucleotidyltransferase with HDIG domain